MARSLHRGAGRGGAHAGPEGEEAARGGRGDGAGGVEGREALGARVGQGGLQPRLDEVDGAVFVFFSGFFWRVFLSVFYSFLERVKGDGEEKAQPEIIRKNSNAHFVSAAAAQPERHPAASPAPNDGCRGCAGE